MVLFLGPFALLLGLTIGAGCYLLGSLLFSEFMPAYALIAVGLIAVAGYVEYLVISAMRRFLGKARLLPLEGLMTRL